MVRLEDKSYTDGWTVIRRGWWFRCCGQRMMIVEKLIMLPCGKHIRHRTRRYKCQCCGCYISWGGY